MKRAYIFLAIIIFISGQTFSQPLPDRLSQFRTDVLPQYQSFFKSADINQSGQLVLYANSNFASMPADEKKSLMDKLTRAWQSSLIIVSYEGKYELWSWDNKVSKSIRLDSWDLNAAAFRKPAAETLSGTALHPWFVYLGGLGQYNSSRYLTVAFNSRVGFYLLRDRVDFAWTLSVGGSGYDTATINTNLSYGIMSKVYFPIKKARLSPNVGVSLDNNVIYTADQTSSSASASALAGISWFVGKGSLDLEFRYGKEFTTMVGYTFYPSAGSGKKKK